MAVSSVSLDTVSKILPNPARQYNSQFLNLFPLPHRIGLAAFPIPDPVVSVTAKVVLEDHQGDLVVVRGAVGLRVALVAAYSRRQILLRK